MNKKFMNRERDFFGGVLPLRIDAYSNYGVSNKDHSIHYDKTMFQAKSIKAVINKVLRHVFDGGTDNRNFKKESLKEVLMPLRIDSFNEYSEYNEYMIEYDGWNFEANSIKAVINKVLKYIFVGGEE